MAKHNLEIFKPSETDTDPLANENVPPMTSIIILIVGHPLVVFILQFQYIAGIYFRRLINSLQYPKRLKTFQYLVLSITGNN